MSANGRTVVVVTSGNPSFAQNAPRKALLSLLTTIERRLADRDRRSEETVMRWNEDRLRRIEAIVVGIMIAIVAIAFVASKLR